MIQQELPFTNVPVKFNHGSDLSRAKNYLKNSSLPMPPDRVKEILGLKTSAATLARKFRAASTGDNPELRRDYVINDQGRYIAYYSCNPSYKEIK